MRKPDYDRRVVVTGLGVISSVGNDVDDRLDEPRQRASPASGRSPASTRPRTRPSSAARSTTSIGRRLDGRRRPPAAANRACTSGSRRRKQALADSGFEITDENRTEVGVVFGSGAGGQALMIDNYMSTQGARAAHRRPDVHRQRARRQLLGDDRDRDRRDRPQPVRRVGLRDRDAQRRRGRRGDPPRRLHRGHQRLDRGAAARGRAMPASRTCAGWACRGPARHPRPCRGRST